MRSFPSMWVTTMSCINGNAMLPRLTAQIQRPGDRRAAHQGNDRGLWCGLPSGLGRDMGYHVSILRTGVQDKTIRSEEIVSIVAGQFGFELERTNAGTITQALRKVSDDEVLFFYDGTELWTKNPTAPVLRIMIEIASTLGNGARVRGDEGETYESVTKTYIHPDDANVIKAPKFYWKDVLSWSVPVLASLIFVYGFGKLLFRYLSK